MGNILLKLEMEMTREIYEAKHELSKPCSFDVHPRKLKELEKLKKFSPDDLKFSFTEFLFTHHPIEYIEYDGKYCLVSGCECFEGLS